jgi:hypothetical protein
MIRELGREYRLPLAKARTIESAVIPKLVCHAFHSHLVPPATSSEPMEAACPMHMVITSGLMYCIVS